MSLSIGLFKWSACDREGTVPQFSVSAGKDGSGRDVYIAKANVNFGVVPGQLVNGSMLATFSWDGNQIWKEAYQVLTAPENSYQWRAATMGNIPLGAVTGGCDPVTCEMYYIGRVRKPDGGFTCGRVHPSLESCYVGFDGKEEKFRNYEVLVDAQFEQQAGLQQRAHQDHIACRHGYDHYDQINYDDDYLINCDVHPEDDDDYLVDYDDQDNFSEPEEYNEPDDYNEPDEYDESNDYAEQEICNGNDGFDDNRDQNDYNDQFDDYNDQMEDYDDQFDDHNDQMEDYDDQFDDHNDQMEDYDDQFDDYNYQLDDYNYHYNDQYDDYNDQYDDYNDQYDDYNDQYDDYNDQYDDYNDQYDDYNDQFDDYNDQYDDYNDQLDDYNDHYNDEYDDYNDHYNDQYNDYNDHYNDQYNDYNDQYDDYNDHNNDQCDDYNDPYDDYYDRDDDYNDNYEDFDDQYDDYNDLDDYYNDLFNGYEDVYGNYNDSIDGNSDYSQEPAEQQGAASNQEKPGTSSACILQRTEEDRFDRVCCKICMETAFQVVFNCGHAVCSDCSGQLEICHMCREPITARIRLYELER